MLDLDNSKAPSVLRGAGLGAVVALAGCAAEGAVAAGLMLQAGGGAWAVLEAGLLTAGLFGLAALPVCLAAGVLLSTRAARRLGEGLSVGLGSGEGGAAVLAGASAIATGILGGIIVGAWAAARMSPRFAAATGALAAVGLLVLALPLAAAVGQGLGGGARRFTPLGLLLRPSVVQFCLAGLGYAAVAAALPDTYAGLPAGMLAGSAGLARE